MLRAPILVLMAVVAGSVTLLHAQGQGKGKGKNDPPPNLPAVATMACPFSFCGLDGEFLADTAALFGQGGEVSIRVESAADGFLFLDFDAQTPADSTPSDCADDLSTCLFWDWTTTSSGTFHDMHIGTNSFEADGETELAGGLLAMNVGQSYTARFNISVRTDRLWRLDFNPTIPSDGGADVADVTRVDDCTWVFSADSSQKAALSVISNKNSRKGTRVHREGLFKMPFELTFVVPELCPSGP